MIGDRMSTWAVLWGSVLLAACSTPEQPSAVGGGEAPLGSP